MTRQKTIGKFQEPAVEEPLLTVEDLQVNFASFDGVHHVLDDINMSVGRGEVVTIAGETGCGKSVTMRSILGLLDQPPAQIDGTITFDGQELYELPEKQFQQLKGRRISMVFQDPMTSLNPVFTIGEQLTDTAQFGGGKSAGKLDYIRKKYLNRTDRSQARQRVLEMLRDVQMPDPERIMTNYPTQLSGGMRQRALIAQALLNEPELLIADELGTALDVTIHDQILSLLERLIEERNLSVLMITHNLGAARHLSDRVYIMYGGRIVEAGAVEKIFDQPEHPYTQGLMSSVPKLTGEQMAKGIDGSIPEYLDPPEGCRFHPRCPYAHERCRTDRPELYATSPGNGVACFLYDEQESPYDQPRLEETKARIGSVEEVEQEGD